MGADCASAQSGPHSRIAIPEIADGLRDKLRPSRPQRWIISSHAGHIVGRLVTRELHRSATRLRCIGRRPAETTGCETGTQIPQPARTTDSVECPKSHTLEFPRVCGARQRDCERLPISSRRLLIPRGAFASVTEVMGRIVRLDLFQFEAVETRSQGVAVQVHAA